MVTTNTRLPNPITVIGMITADWRAEGRAGEPTAEYVRRWRDRYPVYGRHSLHARFFSGSAVPCRPVTALDRAAARWLALGRTGRPGGEEFERMLAEEREADRG